SDRYVAIRIFQHYWQLPLAILAAVEALIFFAAPYGTAIIAQRLDLSGLGRLEDVTYSLGFFFAGTLFLSMTAMGLYNARQRSRLPGVLARVAASVFGG